MDFNLSGCPGGVIGTASGFGKLLQDQLRPHSAIFDNATRNLFFEPQATSNGSPIPMTLGWHIGNRDDRRYFFKEGGGGGFRCLMRLYVEHGIGSVVMTNASGFDVHAQLNALDHQFLGGMKEVQRK
jgi:hypothetical protein